VVVRQIFCDLLTLYWLILFATAISSWLPPPRYGSPLRAVASFLHAVTEPVLRPVRRLLPPVGTGAIRIDLAFIVVLIFVVVLHVSICP
jgi:YggT family protein